MAHKLDRFKQQILDFKADGESVRSIASKLTELSGEKIAASTVQHFLKQGNGNGESKESPQVSEAIPARDMDSIQVRLDELQGQLLRIENKVSDLQYGRLGFKIQNWINRILSRGWVLRGTMWVQYDKPKKWRFWEND